ncbi:MAG: R3H domain-containing nucleic acid-binding protein [Candidatus Margulisiibacteriota bacterium]
MPNIKISDTIKSLLEILPPHIKEKIYSRIDFSDMIEVILDLGKKPEVRFEKKVFTIEDETVSQEDIDHIITKVGKFTSDNRAGIERSLHRISCIRNRTGKIIGLTCRVGRAAVGTISIIRDIIESNKSILFMGPPGIGKTTKLREAARVLSEEFNKRVIVVDTSNEIAGDGDIPHPGIGKSRRMQVPSPERQHAVMIEAVENHMPEVIIIDEIGTLAEAEAARTIAERGVVLIGTAHGICLENLVSNPTLSDLVGGVQTVILGDEEAKRRRTQKAILERKAPPTFDIVVEIRERDTMAIYSNVAEAVDKLLRGRQPQPEVRIRNAEGKIEIKEKPPEEMPEITEEEIEEASRQKTEAKTRIFVFGVNKSRFDRGIASMGISARTVDSLDEADIVVTTKPKAARGGKITKAAQNHNVPVHILKSNTSASVMKFLKNYFRISETEEEYEETSLNETKNAIEEVNRTNKTVDLSPQNSYIRRLQHQLVERHDLRSEAVGQEPHRRVRIYPR